MVKASKRVWIWGCILGLGLLGASYAQEAPGSLLLKSGDLLLERHEDPGLHLFIRKNPAIASVMLMESTRDPQGREPTYAYRSLEWNSVNDIERSLDASDRGALWPLLDSSPEIHPSLGEAFHIYIPPVIVYGGIGSRQETVVVADGLYINIRTFFLPHGDTSGGFADNPFTLRYAAIQNPPALRRDAVLLPPDPPPPLLPDEEPETPALIPAPPAIPQTQAGETPQPPDEARSDEAHADEAYADEVRRIPENEGASPPLEPETYPLVIDTRFALSMFFPGSGGLLLPSLPLTNTYNPVGALTLARQFNKNLAFVLELERESLSLNRLVGRAAWDAGVVGIEAGPSLGILNTETLDISPGLSLLLRLRLPTWKLSGLFRFDFALGREPAVPGQYTQSYASAALGYAFPWVKLTLGVFERGSTLHDSKGILRVGRWIRYNLAANFPSAPASWDFRVELGYEQLQWDYKLSTPLEYRYAAVYAGLEASYTPLPDFLTLIAGLEGPVYPFVYPALIQNLDDPQESFYGRITLGCRLSLR
jgi:hypothetical protein